MIRFDCSGTLSAKEITGIQNLYSFTRVDTVQIILQLIDEQVSVRNEDNGIFIYTSLDNVGKCN